MTLQWLNSENGDCRERTARESPVPYQHFLLERPKEVLLPIYLGLIEMSAKRAAEDITCLQN
jgi:hypothetical protein